jgi:hypothetical protein
VTKFLLWVPTSFLVLNSAVGIVNRQRAERPKNYASVPVNGKYCFSNVTRPAMRPIQPHIQWVSGPLCPRVKWPGVKLASHLHLMPSLRINEAIPLVPHVPSWLTCGQLSLLLFQCLVAVGHVMMMNPLTLKVSLVDASIFKFLKLPDMLQVVIILNKYLFHIYWNNFFSSVFLRWF